MYYRAMRKSALLGKTADALTFIEACGSLRYWPRELAVDLDAGAN